MILLWEPRYAWKPSIIFLSFSNQVPQPKFEANRSRMNYDWTYIKQTEITTLYILGWEPSVDQESQSHRLPAPCRKL